jgi:hypothetical protein
MATVALSKFVPNSSLADPAGTTLAAGTNPVTPTASLPGSVVEEVVLRVVTATATTALTVKAGSYPPALSSGQGDLVVSCSVGTTWVGPLNSARFLQSDGTVSLTSATPANQTVTAFWLPRTA